MEYNISKENLQGALYFTLLSLAWDVAKIYFLSLIYSEHAETLTTLTFSKIATSWFWGEAYKWRLYKLTHIRLFKKVHFSFQ